MFNQVIQIKAEKTAQEAAERTKEEERKALELANDVVDINGDFSVIFSDAMLGLIYMMPLDVELKTQGTVSPLFADEQGAQEVQSAN